MLDDPKLDVSKVSAVAALFRPAKSNEIGSADAQVRLFEGQLWREEYKAHLSAHSISNEHSHWLGELFQPKDEEQVIVVSEYSASPGISEQILQWEGSIRVGR